MFSLPILLSPMRQLCELLLLHCHELFSLPYPSSRGGHGQLFPCSYFSAARIRIMFSGRSRTAGAPRILGGICSACMQKRGGRIDGMG